MKVEEVSKVRAYRIIYCDVCFQFLSSPTFTFVPFPSPNGGGEHTVSPTRPCIYSRGQTALLTCQVVLSMLQGLEVRKEHTFMKDSQGSWLRHQMMWNHLLLEKLAVLWGRQAEGQSISYNDTSMVGGPKERSTLFPRRE